MKCFKAFYVYMTLENQFQIFIFEKNDFFLSARIAQLQKSNILGHNFLLVFPNVMKFGAYERILLVPTFYQNFILKYGNF